ncbi:MAG: type IV pilus modification protein PilV [Endozoicomonas sp.]
MKNYNGFTMIEVLVAMIIISVGLLGVAGLFAESQKSIQEVQQRSIALLQAEDILARMNANVDGLGNYDGVMAAMPAQPATLCNTGVTCSPADTAAYDLWRWATAIHGAGIKNQADANVGGLLLPIACIDVNGNNVRLTIAWRGKYARPDASPGINCGNGNANFASGGVNNALRRLMVIETTVS